MLILHSGVFVTAVELLAQLVLGVLVVVVGEGDVVLVMGDVGDLLLLPQDFLDQMTGHVLCKMILFSFFFLRNMIIMFSCYRLNLYFHFNSMRNEHLSI